MAVGADLERVARKRRDARYPQPGVGEQQLAKTRDLRGRAERQGSLRLLEVLERDERSLTRILDGLDELEADRRENDADRLNVIELAAARQPAAGNRAP